LCEATFYIVSLSLSLILRCQSFRFNVNALIFWWLYSTHLPAGQLGGLFNLSWTKKNKHFRLQNGRDREIGVKFEEETLDFEFSFLTRNKKRKVRLKVRRII